eukprot:gnl/Spiro4/11130_TR5905_c0_g1_i1.p1 gnl/Spiro4/11130_TR5905_c0_g1~~gnl/Spiro4/11130_TR5905_c0_g1_i1.p1  ORF type:complete len:218 (-),score=34.51 gnl/Spiro4/11130_TR5905_c0_g1_i1:119-772(-)
MEQLSSARRQLQERYAELMGLVAGLTILSLSDERRKDLPSLREQCEALFEELKLNQRDISMFQEAMRPLNQVESLSATSTTQPQPPSFFRRLPPSLPKFPDPDRDVVGFVEALTCTLLAHGLEESRWPAALLACCTEESDQVLLRDLLTKEWCAVKKLFVERHRDPSYYEKVSTCHRCGQRGHWSPACPLRVSSTSGPPAAGPGPPTRVSGSASRTS